MKKFSKILLLVLILALVVSGALLFVYRLPLLDRISEFAGVSDKGAPVVDSFLPAEMINLEAINSKRLDSLVNQVTSFNFDNICRRPSGLQTGNSSCVLGNGQPFKKASDK